MASYYSKIVIGVPLEAVAVPVTERTKVKRFNEVTGEPYDFEEEEHSFMVNGKSVDDYEEALKALGFEHEPYLPKEPVFAWITTEYEGQVIGLFIKEVELENGGFANDAYSIPQLTTWFKQVREKLQSIGCNANPELRHIAYGSA